MFNIMSLLGGGNTSSSNANTGPAPDVWNTMGPPAPQDISKIVDPSTALANAQREQSIQDALAANQAYRDKAQSGMFDALPIKQVAQSPMQYNTPIPYQGYQWYRPNLGRPMGLFSNVRV